MVNRWQRFETEFISSANYANPFRDVKLSITFTSPSGQRHTVEGFWDGGGTWRVRFVPDEVGNWSFKTSCSHTDDGGLHGQTGHFTCSPASGTTRFERHGPISLSANRRYFAHADGTPFLWIGDTAWNGPLRASESDWEHYLNVRRSQQFNVVQWVATQWRAAQSGDEHGQLAYTGREQITVNPAFFQRLDARIEAMNRAGFLSVPVMMWAFNLFNLPSNRLNPGADLPESEAILLGRYMVARWHAHHTVWILSGDADYEGETAERWKRIGRGIFSGAPHAPVTVHPISLRWTQPVFEHEDWFDYIGYQSGHGDNEEYISWLVDGPAAAHWNSGKPRPVVNLEPPYEDHVAYHSRQPFNADETRKRLYWSLLVTPTAGVTYGGHGVWGWDDGTCPPEDHEGTGIPKPWREALHLPAAEQICHLAGLFDTIEWWRLVPAPELVEPGVMVSQSPERDLIVVYLQGEVTLSGIPDDLSALWFDPRTGSRQAASLNTTHFTTPSEGDWVLVLGRAISLPAK